MIPIESYNNSEPHPNSESETIRLRERVYNLSLYLAWIENHKPRLFRKLMKLFSGLPGYAGLLEFDEAIHDGGAYDTH